MCKLTGKKTHTILKIKTSILKIESAIYERFWCGKSHMIDAKNLLNTQRQELKTL